MTSKFIQIVEKTDETDNFQSWDSNITNITNIPFHPFYTNKETRRYNIADTQPKLHQCTLMNSIFMPESATNIELPIQIMELVIIMGHT